MKPPTKCFILLYAYNLFLDTHPVYIFDDFFTRALSPSLCPLFSSYLLHRTLRVSPVDSRSLNAFGFNAGNAFSSFLFSKDCFKITVFNCATAFLCVCVCANNNKLIFYAIDVVFNNKEILAIAKMKHSTLSECLCQY